MLELVHVSKSYLGGEGAPPTSVLRDVTFQLGRAQSVAIVGASGSGKSTLLNIIGTLDRPTSGEVRLDGRDLTSLNEADLAAVRSRGIGFIFQLHHLLPQCSVLENVLTPTLVARDQPAGTYLARARTLLEQVGLSHRLDHRPSQLSGGEKQRAALARALVRQPTLLLCDEPTGNLDQHNAGTVADLLLSLHKTQRTVLVLVTHSPDLASRFSRRFSISDSRLVDVA